MVTSTTSISTLFEIL